MARPKYNKNETPAKDRLDNAFWSLLKENKYQNITIKALASEAKINHNTFYYYYESIDDMAQKVFNDNLANDLTEQLLDRLSSYNVCDVISINFEMFTEKGAKSRLYARGESAYLLNIFKDSICNAWLTGIHVSKVNLSYSEQIDLEFIFCGLVSILGKSFQANKVTEIISIFERDLGQGIISTLNHLKEKYAAS